MIHGQMTKVMELFAPQSVATNGTATGTVSCAGFDYAEVVLHLGTAVASNVDTTITLTESDGTTYTTSSDLSLTTVAPNTNGGQIYKWFLNMGPRKKNLKITYNPNTNAARTAEAHVILSRAEQGPTTIAQQGVAARVVA